MSEPFSIWKPFIKSEKRGAVVTAYLNTFDKLNPCDLNTKVISSRGW